MCVSQCSRAIVGPIRITVFLLYLFGFSACYAEDRGFNVAVVIPLSGALAEYGTAIKNGFELARADDPKFYSTINFTYEDSGYDGKTAVNALQKLIAARKYDLYYLWGVSPTEAMLPIAEKENLAVIAETTIKEATVGRALVIRAARTGERIAQALAAEIALRSITQVSFLTTQIPFYLDIVANLRRILAEKGVQIRADIEVLPSDLDFKSSLLKHKRADAAGAIGAFLLPAQLVAFYKQMDQLKIQAQTFNADILDSVSIVKECPDSVNAAFFSQVGVTSDFRAQYSKKFNSDIHIGSAAQAYDVAVVIKDLFGRLTGKLTAHEIIQRISALAPRSGVTGKLAFTDMRESGKEIRMPVSMKVVRDKRIDVLTEDTGF